MSSRTINQSSIPAPPLTVRAKAPVFSTEDKLYENRVGGHSEQSTYPTYPTTFKAYVPTAERTLHAIESTARSQPVAMPESDRLMNARQVAARLGVSERWVRDHTTRSRREAQGTRTLCTRSGSRQIYRNQPAVPNETRPSRDRWGLPDWNWRIAQNLGIPPLGTGLRNRSQGSWWRHLASGNQARVSSKH
jgi:hypothetical protein